MSIHVVKILHILRYNNNKH